MKSSLRDNITALRQSAFLKTNSLFFVASLAISFVNYLYYPVLGRFLPLREFGELQVIVSVFGQITILFSVLTLVSTNIVINEKNTEKANETIREIEKIALYIAAVVLVVLALFSVKLQSVFQFSSPVPFVLLGLLILVSVPLAFRTAYIRGKKDFFTTAKLGMIASVAKLLASALLVLLSFKTLGALVGIITAQVLALIYGAKQARILGFTKSAKKQARPNWKLLRPQAKYSALVLVVSLLIVLQTSLDITLVKSLFSPEDAGAYSGISIISNIVYFISGAFGTILLSSVEIAKPPKENSSMLIKSLCLTALLAGGAAGFFVLFPSFVINLLIGAKYQEFAQLLPYMSCSMLALALANLITSYHIALRHYKVVFIVGVGALISYTLLIMNHQSPSAIVYNMLAGNVTILTSLLLWTGFRAIPRIH